MTFKSTLISYMAFEIMSFLRCHRFKCATAEVNSCTALEWRPYSFKIPIFALCLVVPIMARPEKPTGPQRRGIGAFGVTLFFFLAAICARN